MRDGLGDWRNAQIGGHVNPGWEPLVDKLYERLIAVAPEIVIDQVKEKFGTLRFYWHLPSEVADIDITQRIPGTWSSGTLFRYVESVVDCAEIASTWICEVCGKAGAQTRSGGTSGWLNTLCDEHFEIRHKTDTPAWKIVEDLKAATA